MKEISGDIWDFHDKGSWVVITTNGSIKTNGECVMGRGVALEAKTRFPGLPKKLGELIQGAGVGMNKVFFFPSERLITFPVKYLWNEKADFDLIVGSCNGLLEGLEWTYIIPPVYMVRPGCGNGHLKWEEVKPLLEQILDDRFIVVEKHG